MTTYNINQFFNTTEATKSFVTRTSILYIKDRKFVATQVEKIKNGTAKFYTIEKTEVIFDAAIKAYKN